MKLLLLLGAGFLLLFLLEKGYERFWYRRLQVSIQFQPQPAREGEEAFLVETIENQKHFPIPTLQAEFLVDNGLGLGTEENASKSDKQYKRDIFTVASCQKISRKITFSCQNRGYYEIRQANLTAKSLLMKQTYFRDEEENTYLYVYPRTISVSALGLPLKKLTGTLEQRRGILEDPFTFAGIREYDGADSMNKINWKASAKTGSLMVNMQNSTYAADLTCFLDVEDATLWEHGEIHEEGIRLAVSLMGALLQKGVPAAFVTNGFDCQSKEEIQLLPGSGRGQLEKLNRGLSRLDLSEKKKKRPLIELLQEKEKQILENSQVILVITENQSQELFSLAERLGKQGGGVLWIGTCYKDAEWNPPKIPNVDFIKWEVKRQ